MAKRRSKDGRRIALMLFSAVLALAVLLLCAWGLGRLADKRHYRLDYPEEILASSAAYGLDARLVAAVIHTESSNRSGAVSPSGAVGLMQLMPDTAGWIADKQDRRDYTAQRLTEPALNIDLGCWYLRYLMDKYGNQRCALAAYNAGPGNVDKWLEDPRYSKDGALLIIPFEETEEYVSRIDRAYKKYETLYEKELG